MNLHRSLKHEWSSLPPEKYNHYQVLASRSSGIVTPGNAMSIIGLLLVMIGLILILRGNLGSGIGLVVVGRLADILDGIVAEATKTKSPVGEAVDATIDKIVAFAALTVLTFVGLVPLFVGVLFLIHNVVTIGIFGLARLKGGGLHPNTLGKISTAGEWIVVTGFTAVYAFGPQTPLFDTLKVGLYLLSGAIFVLAVISIMAYMRQAFRVSHD